MRVLPARVLATVLDNTTYPEIFKANGEWASIGGIVFEFVETPLPGDNLEGRLFALPLLANLKNYPVKNEIVSLLISSDTSINTNTNSYRYYYLPATNVWSSNHHNAIPQEVYQNQGLQPAQKKDYLQVGQGSVRRVTDGSTEIKFDNGFKERIDIRPLSPFSGDIIVEGRWGHSLRLGSTNNSTLPNTWSSTGEEGDPIIILRNNQYKSSLQPWIPLSEDVNLDGGSIYMTSTQKIPVTTNNFRVDSFNDVDVPVAPKEYTQDQIMLNSGRLVFVSKEDSILLTSANSVHLSAARFNVDSNTTTLQSSRIELGTSDTNLLHPVAKGDKVVELFTDILELLRKLTIACSAAGNGSGPILSLQQFAVENQSLLAKLNTSFIESKDVYTT
jgi:hypothetical protein